MSRIFYIFVLLLCCHWVVAQEENIREANHDLRGGVVMFVVDDVKAEQRLMAERTSGGEHFLLFWDDVEEIDEVRRFKLDSATAQQLDQQLSAAFFKIQYELPVDGNGCKVKWKVTLRGEAINVCSENDKKAQEMRLVWELLSQKAKG